MTTRAFHETMYLVADRYKYAFRVGFPVKLELKLVGAAIKIDRVPHNIDAGSRQN